jgi:hypothetical protein
MVRETPRVFIVVFWVTTPCSLVGGLLAVQVNMPSSSGRQAVCSSKTVVTTYQVLFIIALNCCFLFVMWSHKGKKGQWLFSINMGNFKNPFLIFVHFTTFHALGMSILVAWCKSSGIFVLNWCSALQLVTMCFICV